MLAKLTAKDVRTWLKQLRTTCQCCARSIDARRDQSRCCAAGACCSMRLSPLTLAYIHSVLKTRGHIGGGRICGRLHHLRARNTIMGEAS